MIVYYVHQSLPTIQSDYICMPLYPTAIGPGEVAGIIVGVLALLVTLLLVLAFLVRRRGKRRWV